MVSINTNLSSIMVQGNLNQATNGLNKAIERLSTGYKINHSSDNAANYSIANSYEAKLSSFDMAASNVGMGSDLLAVAQDTISSMQDHGARLHALITQARNGTYGAQSLNALTQEAGALISEIQRMYTNAEYNGINLFDNMLPNWAKEVREKAGNITVKSNGFIADIEKVTPDVVITEASDLADAIANNSIIGIANADVLHELANIVNSGNTCEGKTITLTDDIDLSDYQEGQGWTTIGTSSNQFNGTFDGQGHKITELLINRNVKFQGLFGGTAVEAEIKNLSVDGSVKGRSAVGIMVGENNGTINNCHTSGYVSNTATGALYSFGGIAGNFLSECNVSNCYSDADISTQNANTGGLAGTSSANLENCFCTGNVTTTSNYVGGLVGRYYSGSVTNCYSTGDVTGNTNVGGIIGDCESTIITNCYTSGNISGVKNVGGILGYGDVGHKIKGCYTTGDINGTNKVGGIAGYVTGIISISYSTSNISGNTYVGGIVGEKRISASNGEHNFDKLLFSGIVNGEDKVGSLIGAADTSDGSSQFKKIKITNAYVSNFDVNPIGGTYSSSGNVIEYDMSDWLQNTKEITSPETTLQVGIHGDESSKITFNTGFSYDLSAILRDIKSDESYNAINKFMSTLSDKATELGSVSNRLESALDSIIVNMENITSSLSTIKDADMATESSRYIKMQILQQASATLLATANQSPSIALQLI